MATNSSLPSVPAHVPPGLVFDFDMYTGPEVTRCPHQSLTALQKLPDIFYTPRNGGHWVITRQKMAVDVLQTPEIFSNDPTYSDPSVLMTAVKRVPLDLDPPDHSGYRKILNAMFSPKAVRDLEPLVRAQAQSLVEAVLPDGECDFVSQIAEHYPPEIFLKLLGIPSDRRETFVAWVDAMARSPDPATARETSLRVAALMRDVLAERRANPGDDIISRLLTEEFEGRPLNEDELVGICVLLFIGGLDTVVALISFIMLYLAGAPEHRRLLAAEPARIGDALEEMIRRFSISCIFRYTARDAQFGGIDFKAGDRALLVHPIYGIDDREIANPLEVDFDRPVSRHTAFGAGPHRCLGSHLARLELKVFLEEWLSRIPEFELAIDIDELGYRGGKIIQPLRLPLHWARGA